MSWCLPFANEAEGVSGRGVSKMSGPSADSASSPRHQVLRLVDEMALSAAMLGKIRFAQSATEKSKVPRKLMPSI